MCIHMSRRALAREAIGDPRLSSGRVRTCAGPFGLAKTRPGRAGGHATAAPDLARGSARRHLPAAQLRAHGKMRSARRPLISRAARGAVDRSEVRRRNLITLMSHAGWLLAAAGRGGEPICLPASWQMSTRFYARRVQCAPRVSCVARAPLLPRGALCSRTMRRKRRRR